MIEIKRKLQIGDFITRVSNKKIGEIIDGDKNNNYRVKFISTAIWLNEFEVQYLKKESQQYKDYLIKLEEVANSKTNTLTEIKEVLEEVFGEDNIDQQGTTFTFRIPERTITNGIISHTYKDFYVYFEFQWDNSLNSYRLIDEQGLRGQITFAEYCATYGFSYCQTYDRWSTFCYGADTIIYKIKNELNSDGYDYDLFVNFVYTFKNYLGWETREGTPWRKISNIKISEVYKNTIISPTTLQLISIYQKFISLKQFPDFIFSEGYYKIVNNDRFKDLVDLSCSDIYKLPYDKNRKEYKTELNIPDINREIEKVNEYNRNGDNSITFKGNTFYQQIIDGDFKNDIVTDIYVANEVINAIIPLIEDNYNKYLHNKYLKKHEHYITKVY